MTEEKIAPEAKAEETPAEASPPAEIKTPTPETEKLPESAPEEVVPKAAEKVKPEETAKEEPKEEPVEEPALELEEELEEEGKKKKIRQLSLAEVEKKLNRARVKMGGEASVYIRHLKERKQKLEDR